MSLQQKSMRGIRSPSSEGRGFALVVTLSLMVLLTVIAVGLLTLSSIGLRSSAAQGAQSAARANARMALMLAIGELQKVAGPDQCVSAEAAILGKNSTTIAQPHWTGVWTSRNSNITPPTAIPKPKWLVSGTDGSTLLDPANPPANLFTIAKDLNSTTGVAVPRQSVVGKTSSNPTGAFAYWVSDEGGKSRVNVTPPTVAPTAEERMARSVVSQEAALAKAGAEWENTTNAQKARLVSMATSSLVTTGNTNEVPKKYQHDLTSDGYGLPVDVSAGGFKKDLTTIFDDKSLGPKYLGATFDPSATAGKVPFTVTDANKFYLVDDYAANSVGPNWGNLYNYADLRRATNVSFISSIPSANGVDARINNMPPYAKSSSVYGGITYIDTQHQNTQIAPVMSVFRVGFRLSATPAAGGKYQLRLHVKPIIGLWNPYNVKLQTNTYNLLWATCSYLKLKITEPGGIVRESNIWLRELARNQPGNTGGAAPQNFSNMTISNVAFEPGEFRAFSVSTTVALGTSNVLVSKLNGKEAFFSDLSWNGSGLNVPASGLMLVPPLSQVSIKEMYLDDLQTPVTKTRWANIKDNETTSYFIIRTPGADLCRFPDMWLRSDGGSSSVTIPEKFAGIFPTKTVETLAANVYDPDASWEFRLRTSDQSARPLRNLVDANPRAISMNPRWDGSTGTNGWWFSSPYAGSGPNRTGLVTDPTFQSTVNGNFNHFGGNSSEASGQTRVAAFEVPRAPLVSLAQFQHAMVSRYNFEPSFVVGNSQASMRAPLNQTSVQDYGGMSGFKLVDTSYQINRRLWDSYFFSTLSGSFKAGGASADSAYPLADTAYSQKLPNPRHAVIPISGDQGYAQIQSASANPAEAIASRIGVVGAFNINSTSVTAWKTQLASLANAEIPTVSPTGTVIWSGGTSPRFSHFSTVLDASGSNSDISNQAFWLSFRKLSDPELNSLATEIVKEVKARGPFRSLAEFVNRNPKSTSIEQQRKGALQAALDKTLNAPLQGAGTLTQIPGMNNDAFDSTTENQTAGNNGYVSQADVLQAIGPVIQARSDCFRIRAMGEVRSSDGTKVMAQAICEAVIQRVASFVDPSNPPETPVMNPSDQNAANPALNLLNQSFGRNLRILSFRWLQPSEI